MAERKKRDTRWKPGQSGNPEGKKPGTRHKTTMAVEALLDGEAEQLTRRCIEKAKEGDMTAMRLCMERICPAQKGRTVAFSLPAVKTSSDVVVALGALLNGVSRGDLAVEEAQAVAGVLEMKRRALETEELERRIQELENRQ